MPAAFPSYQYFNLASALEYLVDSQGVRDMLPLLKKALDRDVPEVTQLLGRGDRAEAAARLHALKGFLPIFCFPALFNELVRVEKLCRVTADADLLDAYDALARQLRGLAQEVAHYELEAS